MIRAIIFDCFGVLYGGSAEYLAAQAPQGRAVEVLDSSNAKDYGYITYQQHLQEVGDILGISAQEVDAIIAHKHYPNEQLIAYARSLRGQFKTGLLSNVGDHMMDRLFDGNVQGEFDVVVLSFNEGMIKPDPNIFLLTAERLGVLPEECIMIDDREANCDGARRAGMQAILHTTNDITRQHIVELTGQQV